MPRRLFRLYQRKRVININANIIAAGLLAIAFSKIVVWIAETFAPEGTAAFFTTVAVVSDIIFDVAVYYVLHWVANHWKPLRPRTKKDLLHHRTTPPPFFKDASLVQFERMILSPLYYIIAAGLMYVLQTAGGMRPGWALMVAFPVGLLVTRVIHTWYGLKTGRFGDDGGFKPGLQKSKVAMPELTATAPTEKPREHAGASH